jgi:hypothetical protein
MASRIPIGDVHVGMLYGPTLNEGLARYAFIASIPSRRNTQMLSLHISKAHSDLVCTTYLAPITAVFPLSKNFSMKR